MSAGRRSVLLAGAASLASLAGCVSGDYGRVRSEARAGIRMVTREVPEAPRVACVRQTLARGFRNPAAAKVYVNEARSVTAEVPGGMTPQTLFVADAINALVGLGFTVVLHPKSADFILEAHLTAFAPVTRSVQGREDADFIVLGGDRESALHWGSVRATATLFNASGDSRESTEMECDIWQLRDSRRWAVSNRRGWLSAGSQRESLEVGSVQHASSLALKEAVAVALGRYFDIVC